MAIEPTTLLTESADDIFSVHKGFEPTEVKPWKFGQASAVATLATGTPIGFNNSTGNAYEWMAPDPTVLIMNGGFTGGTWGVTINGIAIAKTILAWNATAALVAATIFASTGIRATVTLVAGVYTLTFDDEPELITLPTVVGDATSLTGGTAAATTTAGTATYGIHNIKGIVYPEPIIVSATGEIFGVVMTAGRVPYSVLEDNVATGDVAALKAVCREDLLPRGLNVQNLSQVR